MIPSAYYVLVEIEPKTDVEPKTDYVQTAKK